MAVSKKSDLYRDIHILHLIRAVTFVAGAVALAVMLRGKTFPVNALYMTKDALASQSQTIFVPAIKNLFDAPLGYMAAVALLVSGGVALYRYTKGENEYKKNVKKSSDMLKWLDLAISSAVMIEVLALVAGVSDPAVIKMSAGAIVVTCALGWLADRQNVGAKKPDWSAYGISIVTGVLPWLVIAESLLFTGLYGEVQLPWYSYALAGASLVGFAAIAINQLLHIRQHQQWKQYMFVERNYLTIDLLLKLAFAGILIAGLRG